MKKILLIILFLLILPVHSLALEDKAEKLIDSVDREVIYDSLSPQVKDELQNIGADEISLESLKNIDGKKVIKSIFDYFKSYAEEHKRVFLSLLALAVAELFAECTSLEGDMKKAVSFLFSLMAAMLLISSFTEFIEESYEVIRDSIKFMYAFVPVFCSLTASTGKIASANVAGGLLLTLCEVTAWLLDGFFLPFCTAFVILTVSASFSSSKLLLTFSKLIKSVVTGILIFASGALSFILTLTNHITSASDSAVLKISGALTGAVVPVIGSTLKDAGAAFRSCMYMISASVGSFGIIAGLFIFLPSFINLLLFKALLIIFEAVFSNFDDSGTACLISGLKSAVTLILALECFICFIMVISTAIVIYSGYGG